MSTATKERPILFSGPMVRAILDGRKTMTRRVLQEQPAENYEYKGDFENDLIPGQSSHHWMNGYAIWRPRSCPYGAIGDRLWVREIWQPHQTKNHECSIRYKADQAFRVVDPASVEVDWYGVTDDQRSLIEDRWRPSIHMPRWASRITLEVTGVRVERLQSISAKDILAEGVVDRPFDCPHLGKCPVSVFDGAVYPDLKSLWAAGWNNINGKRPGCSWEANPWVWVIEFRRVEPQPPETVK